MLVEGGNIIEYFRNIIISLVSLDRNEMLYKKTAGILPYIRA